MATPGESPTLSIHAFRPPEEPNTLVLIFGGKVQPDDVTGVCPRVAPWLEESDTIEVVCNVGDIETPDAVTIDALARLQLAVRRRGLRLELRGTTSELRDLLELTGLHEAIPAGET